MNYWDYNNNLPTLLADLEKIDNQDEQTKAIEEVTNQILTEYAKDTRFIAQRLLEIKTNIRLAYVPTALMNSLKEAIFCYVNGQYLSSIASVGISSELLSVHLYEMYLRDLKLDEIVIIERIDRFSKISQGEKIDTLFSIVGINESACQKLHKIKKIRNDNIHPHNEKDYKRDALICLRSLIEVINMYSDYIIKLRNDMANVHVDDSDKTN